MVKFDYHTKVYYKDIDQMGVVYYARYLEFFEEARTELLAKIGLIVTEIEKKGFFLPVVSVTCDYKEGARFEDQIIISTTINIFSSARLKIIYEVFRKKDNRLLASGHTVHAFIGKEGKPKRPPQFFLDKLNSVISD
tara:strand:+ start:1049 stop:1459 length:411 start_codon:yes stop_codon:yes gene_type:complete